jgi:hypothetical protein
MAQGQRVWKLHPGGERATLNLTVNKQVQMFGGHAGG